MKWKGAAWTAAILVGIGLAAGAGLWVHSAERTAGDTWHSVGVEVPDRIDVYATVQKVDAVAREVTLRVLVEPRGRLGEDNGVAPAADLTLLNSSSLRGDQTFPAHERIASSDLPIALTVGAVTDYPFDGYDSHIQFAAVQDGKPVPVLLTLDKVDSLFSVAVTGTDDDGGLQVRFTRATSVLVFALFMMFAMWAIAVAVALGARHLIAQRRGLVWPAFGFMAASLFALASFRNAAPGSPPIGSLLDYTAFLWAELIVALSVFASVVAGAVVERKNHKS
ncbi:DUF4436 family protein [Amycolatopsis rhabdoformis]|uniref:DUF4436 family protein n=1 Tax=Amycolatopsis rhabdoformis TaxID=1448059 RepID=A0ABZ1IGR3_9PSEU|nr:DUF4436 family protein [Amycolatopsis rhabdoformis]WSE33313.1 DUF4436 family protein [Amycolatopsis rhabdoformis]